MKITYFQLETHLAKQLSPIYIVSGDEPFLKQEALTLIRKKAAHAEFLERIRITVDARTDPQELYTHLYAQSLLANKRILELDCRDTLPNKNISQLLQEYSAHLSNDLLLLIDIPKIDDKIAKSAWYKALEKQSLVVAIWPITRDQLPLWIKERAKKYKLTLAPDAIRLLVDYVEGNLIAAAQTLEKLYLLKPEETITAALIASVLTDESRFTVFDFIEQLIAGDQVRFLHILNQLQLDGIEPPIILWAITRELRLLSAMLQQLNQGDKIDHVLQKHRIFARRETTIRKFLTSYSLEDCLGYLKHALHLDTLIKSSSSSHIFDEIRLFCLRLV